MKTSNPNVLSQRYATGEMNSIFSEEGKILFERELWLSILKAQKKLGLDIPDSVVENYEAAKDHIDLQQIEELERRTRHDVKARIEAFNIAAGSIEYIHLGMTSRDLTDNVEQLQFMKAMKLVFGRYVSVLRHLVEKAGEYRGIELTGRTHHQAAETTLLGRRFAMWANELYLHLEEFRRFIDSYPLRGMKGPVGTMFDMGALLGSEIKAVELEKIVAHELGFKKIMDATAQVYPRSLDYIMLCHLSALSSAPENYAKTMRLMAGAELVTEGFREGQVGSSVMPHKMNTRSTERICALSELIKMYSDGGSRLSGDQWEEGDVSCSAIRRVIIPDAFYATDGLVETTITVINDMGVYPAIINREVDRYLPFLATTEILALAVKHGLGREKAHSVIKKYAVAEALHMRETGSLENRLIDSLAKDPVFKSAGITVDNLREILGDKRHFVGYADQQIDAVIERTKPMLTMYSNEAKYEPNEIL
jgi:adenylosuccinate lyase